MTLEKKGLVVSAIQRKGGPGKTTLIIALCLYYCKMGKSVIIIDTDTQDSAARWAERMSSLPLEFLRIHDDHQLYPTVEKLKQQFDVILIDTAGVASTMMTAVIQTSDICLVPSKPSFEDATQAISTYKTIQSANQVAKNPSKPIIVLNDANKAAKITKAVQIALSEHNITRLDSVVPSKTICREMLGGVENQDPYSYIAPFNEMIGELQKKEYII